MARAPRAGDRQPRGRGTEGFTLVEVLVAFVVLALFVAVLQRAIVGAVDGTTRAQARLEAGRVASTLIASPLAVGASGASLAGRLDGHDWIVRYEPVAIPAGTPGEASSSTFLPMRMIVEVAAGRAAPVRLETVRLVQLAGGGS